MHGFVERLLCTASWRVRKSTLALNPKVTTMNLDKHGLPCQKDGDCGDQLQRVGMIGVGNTLNPSGFLNLPTAPELALKTLLQPESGVFSRFSGTTTLDVTGDQLVPVFAYFIITQNKQQLNLLMLETLKRFGFAQNTRKQNDPTVRTFPDFILFRILPLIIRKSKLLYPLALVLDLLLVLQSIDTVLASSETNTDDNNSIITMAVCRNHMVTPFSYLATKIYKNFRHPPGPAGALTAYHSAATGGNPEIAVLWTPIVEKF